MDTAKILKTISSIISLTNIERKDLLAAIEFMVLKRNDHFLVEGQICNSIAFINSGSIIYYKTTNEGVEITTDFALEGDWVTNNLSRLTNSKSLINIKALSDTELIVIPNMTLNNLYEKHTKFEKIGRIIMEQAYIQLVQLSIDLQILSAKERYLKLLKTKPKIMQNIPLHHIATYLGIAPKSLSRIRKDITVHTN
jgi:CRP/FNR family transcriptional regulator, anaerobic regulatory protein